MSDQMTKRKILLAQNKPKSSAAELLPQISQRCLHHWAYPVMYNYSASCKGTSHSKSGKHIRKLIC